VKIDFKKIKKHQDLLIIGLLVLIWVTILFFISPEEIVSKIGIKTGYALLFFMALLGISSFTSVSFYTTLIVFAGTGEFNPIILGLVAAPAAAIGDSLFFLLGFKGRSFIPEKYLLFFSNWIEKKPKWFAPIIAFFYTGLTPLPQDFLMLAMGISGVRFWKIFLAILFGNMVFIIIISFLVSSGNL